MIGAVCGTGSGAASANCHASSTSPQHSKTEFPNVVKATRPIRTTWLLRPQLEINFRHLHYDELPEMVSPKKLQ